MKAWCITKNTYTYKLQNYIKENIVETVKQNYNNNYLFIFCLRVNPSIRTKQ